MYFYQHIQKLLKLLICSHFEQGPGDPSFDAEKAAAEAAKREAEAARPETERLAEAMQI